MADASITLKPKIFALSNRIGIVSGALVVKLDLASHVNVVLDGSVPRKKLANEDSQIILAK